MFKKNRMAQSALEFIVLFSFVLLFVSVFLVILQNNLIDVENKKNDEEAAQVADLIMSEVILAEASAEGYQRTFYIPKTIKGVEYTVKSNDGHDVVINYNGKDYIYFFGDLFLENHLVLQTGDVTITKRCPINSRCLISLVP